MRKENENEKLNRDKGYTFLNQTPSQFLERRIATIYGINSAPIRALDLVREEMCVEKGFKRDDGQDYYNHCVDVANTLISFCVKDEDAVCAALLHDIVEDVEGYTEETISRLFNPRVAHLVMLVTKDQNKNYKDPKVIEKLRLADIKTDSRDIINTNNITLRPFCYYPIFSDTSLAWNSSIKMYRRVSHDN